MGIARSGIGWLLAQIGALAVTWLASLYFARALSDPQASLGTFYAFETIISLLVLLANGGLNGAIVKRVSEGDESSEFATAGLLLSAVLVLFCTALVIVSSPLLIDFFGYGGLSVVLIVGTLISYQIRDTLNALLTSEFKIGRSGLVNLVNAIGQVSVQIALIAFGFSALALITGYTIGSMLAALVASVLALYKFQPTRPSRRHFHSLLSFARYSFLNSFVQKFYDNIDIIVITALLGKAATGVYGIGFRFSLLIMVFYSAINRASNPEISKHDAAGDRERVKEVLSDSIVLGLLIGLPAFAGFYVLANPIIITFYTEAFASAAIVAVVAVATRIPEGLRSSFGAVLSGVDRPDISFRGGVILMVCNALLDIALVPTIGIVGAVIASFVGLLLQTVYMGYHVVDILELSYTDFPLKDVAIEAISALIMAGVVFAAKTIVGPPNVRELFSLVALGLIVYFFVVLSLGAEIRNRVFPILNDLLPTA